MGLHDLGKVLIIVGAVMLLVGLVFVLAGKVPFLGKLPGDFVWRRGNTRVYFPLATSILLSILLTIILYIISKISGR